MTRWLKLPEFSLGRFLGFIFTPVGVLMMAWGAGSLAAGAPPIPSLIGLALGLTMILVGVRYVFKSTTKKPVQDTSHAAQTEA